MKHLGKHTYKYVNWYHVGMMDSVPSPIKQWPPRVKEYWDPQDLGLVRRRFSSLEKVVRLCLKQPLGTLEHVGALWKLHVSYMVKYLHNPSMPVLLT